MWVTELDPNTVVGKLQTSQLVQLMSLTINAGKTTAMCFPKRGHSDIVVRLESQTLKQVEFSRMSVSSYTGDIEDLIKKKFLATPYL